MAVTPESSAPSTGLRYTVETLRTLTSLHGGGSGGLTISPDRGPEVDAIGSGKELPWPKGRHPGRRSRRVEELNLGGVARPGDCAVSIVSPSEVSVRAGFVRAIQRGNNSDPGGQVKGGFLVGNEGTEVLDAPTPPPSGQYRIDALLVQVWDLDISLPQSGKTETSFEWSSGEPSATNPGLPGSFSGSHVGLVAYVLQDSSGVIAVHQERAYGEQLALRPAQDRAHYVRDGDAGSGWTLVSESALSGVFTRAPLVELTPARDTWVEVEIASPFEAPVSVAWVGAQPEEEAQTVTPHRARSVALLRAGTAYTAEVAFSGPLTYNGPGETAVWKPALSITAKPL